MPNLDDETNSTGSQSGALAFRVFFLQGGE